MAPSYGTTVILGIQSTTKAHQALDTTSIDAFGFSCQEECLSIGYANVSGFSS